MRYVNPACSVEEQNLVACQSGLDIFFYTTKRLQPGQELLVWYCSEFAQRCNYPPLGQLAIDKNGECVCFCVCCQFRNAQGPSAADVNRN